MLHNDWVIKKNSDLYLCTLSEQMLLSFDEAVLSCNSIFPMYLELHQGYGMCSPVAYKYVSAG